MAPPLRRRAVMGPRRVIVLGVLATACAHETSSARPAASSAVVATDPTPAAGPQPAPDEGSSFDNQCVADGAVPNKECAQPPPNLADDIRRAGTEKINPVRNCYEAALTRVGARSGRLTIGWHINERGDVDCVNVIQDPVRDPVFRACVERAFADVHHVPVPCGAAATWSYGLTPPE